MPLSRNCTGQVPASVAEAMRSGLLTGIVCGGLEETQLENATCVEPLDSQGSPRGGRRSAPGHQANELRADHACDSRGRLPLDRRQELVQSDRFPVLHVRAYLDEPSPLQLEAECSHARKAAVSLANDRSDLPRRRELPS